MRFSTCILCCLSMFCLMVIWLRWIWKRRRLLQLASVIPGPPALPIIGNALLFMAKPEDQLDKITKLTDKYGDYSKFWLGQELNIIVKNPTDVKHLLTSNKVNQKGPIYDHMVPFIGQGILSGGPSWRARRKIIRPIYDKKSIRSFSTVFNEECKELGKVIRNKDLNETFNIYFDVVKCTTQCVCQTLLGLSKKDTQNIKFLDEVVKNTPRIYSIIYSKMTCWWLQIPIIYRFLNKEENYISKLINIMTSDILSKSRNALNRKSVYEKNISYNVVDRLLSDDEVSDEDKKLTIFTLFTTSQEAAAKIASAVLLFLAHLPEWQEKVVKEISEVVEAENEILTESHLKQLRYLDMVYNEALRYLAIGPLIQRTVVEEIAINKGNVTLPVGTSLVIPIHAIHRDPVHWEEPNKVKPERFLPENSNKRDPNAFIPFSLGAMDCLGRLFGTTLIKTLVVKVLQEVVLEADGRLEDLDLYIAISVKFAQGYHVRVHPRTHKN